MAKVAVVIEVCNNVIVDVRAFNSSNKALRAGQERKEERAIFSDADFPETYIKIDTEVEVK